MPIPPEKRYAELARALDGIRADPADPDGWTRFHADISARIRTQLWFLGVRDREAIRDLTQDVLVRFLRYARWRRDWRTLPTAPEVASYFRTVTKNAFIDFARKWTPAPAQPEREPVVLEKIAGTLHDPRAVLERLTKGLSIGDRTLLLMVREGRKLEDIAEALGISYSAAGVRVHRLRAKLGNF